MKKQKKPWLSLATNWDNRLIGVIGKMKLATVKELWGTLNYNPIGSGRGPGPVSIPAETAQEHVKAARAAGLEFCYLLNAPCTGNREYTPRGKSAILDHIEWIAAAGATRVTVANPFLMALIAKHFPSLKLKASVILECNTVQKIKKYMDMGCGIVNLSFDMNRDFRFLAAMPEDLRPDIELLTSDPCLFNCPYRQYHYNQMGHASRHAENTGAAPPQSMPWHELYYPMLCCSLQRCESPAEWIKSRWIRPEDLKIYMDLGYTRFKIGTRNSDTLKLSLAAKSYHRGHFDGDLLELLSEGYFELPNIGRPAKITINNRALDGFLNHFIQSGHNCPTDCGATCQHCEAVAAKAVKIDSQDAMRAYLDALRKLKERISSLDDA